MHQKAVGIAARAYRIPTEQDFIPLLIQIIALSLCV
jgi:hypothetical protein